MKEFGQTYDFLLPGICEGDINIQRYVWYVYHDVTKKILIIDYYWL